MRVLVVDDEALARRRLERLLAKIERVVLVGEAANGAQALEQTESLQPDVVLLDIRMPGKDGLQVARELAQMDNPPAVIFVTAYDDFALQAFDAEALAYLVKPVKLSLLVRALERAGKPNRALSAVKNDGPRRHLYSKTWRGVDLIPVENIRLLQADHKYVTVYHTGGEAVVSDSLKQLEDEFGEQFVRIHRNALVARDAILGLEQDKGHTRVRLRDISGKPLISRRLEPSLRKLILQL